ncbi:MAG TPA: vitamin K epoxide reductase family protein [Candidatus Paceibacterota bacterium]
MLNTFWHVVLLFAAFGGFLLAFYIRHKKHANEKLVCPLDSDCESVIHSDYSVFLGMPVEILGMVYYGIITFSYVVFFVFPQFISPLVVFLALLLSTTAFFFSLYLTSIQIFAIRQICTWCLVSAGLSTAIFFTTLAGSEFGFVNLLAEHKNIIVMLHLFGFGIGLGAVTITDVLFFKFLKDFKISEFEADILHTLSQIIWFALAVVIISGFGLYLPEIQELNQSGKFLAKMIVVAIVLINGIFLNIVISPKLIKISFGKKHEHEDGELLKLRKFAYASGAVSLASWYYASALGMAKNPSLGFRGLLLVYLFMLGAGILISLVFERANSRKEL